MDLSALKNKKLLVLAGAEVHCKIVQAAKELGVYTIVTDYLDYKDSPAKQIADEYWDINITDIDEIVEKCKNSNIDGVLAFCIDPAQLPYQRICEKLGLPCYGNKEQFEILTNKKLFKNYCKVHGLNVIPEYTIEDAFNNRIQYPVIVKPVDSRGSRGQTICNSKEEIFEAIDFAKQESINGDILIEKYMKDGCQDMCLSYTVIDGEPYAFRIGDRFLGTKEDGLQKQAICSIHPSTHAEEYMTKIHPKVCNFIKSLGIKFGGIFMQGIWEDGKVYMYDPGLRFPGTDFDEAIKQATGFDNMKSSVAFAITGDTSSCFGNPQNLYKLNNGTGFILSVSARPGKITSFDGFDEIASHPFVVKASKRHKIGDTIKATGDIQQRVVEFIVFVPNGYNATEFIEYMYSKLNVKNEKGENLVTSKVIFPPESRYFDKIQDYRRK